MILSPERDPPREHQEEMGDGPVVGLSAEQVDRIRPLPQGTWRKRVDDRKVLSGIIPVTQKGLCWVDAPRRWPHKTLYNRCHRW